MSVTQLSFAEPFFNIDYAEREKLYHISRKSMIINLAEHEQENILLEGGRVVLPLKAAVVEDMSVNNLVRAVIIRDFERCDLSDPAVADSIRHTWRSLYEVSGLERHKGLPYYKSPKFCIGEGNRHIELNFCYVSEGGVPSGPHRDHDRDFDEVHAQILGYGMMRLYSYEDHEQVHQELHMAPGTVHEKMFNEDGTYPWHEYKSVTPGIYCPIELDR